jgi:acyl-CoA synthetase (AMP-forming)/AMP-acid ligase II
VTTTTPYRYDVSALRDVFERDFTYLAGIARNAHRFADGAALSDPATGRRWTYAQLWSDAGRLADALGGHGVSPGDTVVFGLFNGPEFALLWVACQRLGAVATPINYRLSPGEVAHVLDDSLPAAYVYDETLQHTAAEAVALASHHPALRCAVASPTRSRRPPRRSTTRRRASTRRGRRVCPRGCRCRAWSRSSPPMT